MSAQVQSDPNHKTNSSANATTSSSAPSTTSSTLPRSREALVALTIVQLKTALKEKGLSVQGTKADVCTHTSTQAQACFGSGVILTALFFLFLVVGGSIVPVDL